MKKVLKYLILIGILSYLIVTRIYPYYLKPIEGNKNVDKSSPYYINDLYASDGYMYQKINDNAKKMYDFLIDKAIIHKSNNDVKLGDFDCKTAEECFNYISDANFAIYIDHPELLSYASFSASSSGEDLNIYINDATNIKLKDQLGVIKIAHIIDEIKNTTKNMSDRDKIIYVYDYIGSIAKYDTVFTSTSKNQSVYNVLIKHNAVCAGFAKTAQIIFQNIGIKSYLALSNNHMWNIVEYDGKYYYFDATVAACINKDNDQYYNGLKQNYFKGSENHILKHAEWYPNIESTNMFKI